MQNLFAETLIKVRWGTQKLVFMCQSYNTKYLKLVRFVPLPIMLIYEWTELNSVAYKRFQFPSYLCDA